MIQRKHVWSDSVFISDTIENIHQEKKAQVTLSQKTKQLGTLGMLRKELRR